MTIRDAWRIYLGVIAEGDKLYAEGDKLYAEGDKLYAEGSKLHAEGRIAFFSVVIANLGNVPTKWITYWDSIEIAGITYTPNLKDKWNQEDSCDGKVVEIDGRKYQLKLV